MSSPLLRPLVSLCRSCHHKVEFDENGIRRTNDEKHRVLEDREGAQMEKMAEEEARHLKNKTEQRVRDAANGRCFWCKGNTEIKNCGNNGGTYIVPTIQGDDVVAWMCSGCVAVLDKDKEGRLRTDQEKLKLLRKKAKVNYTRREPSTGFHFTKSFWKLNAMQREGVMNAFAFNSENIRKLKSTNPKKFAELKVRYEETNVNGIESRARRSGK